MTRDEIDLEEVLLGYLRTSKKIKLAKLDVDTSGQDDAYTVRFEVEKGFPGSLSQPLDNPFHQLLNEIQEDEHRTTEKQEV